MSDNGRMNGRARANWRIAAAVVTAAGLSFLAARSARGRGPERDRQEILRDYEAIKAAHFHRDAAAFLAPYDSSWVVVSSGSVNSRTGALAQAPLQAYLDSMTFTDITDVESPRIEVATDGDMAWLLGHVRIRGQRRRADGTTIPIEFESAFVDVWRKHGGRWRIVAHANTERDSAAAP
jgi:ketosteroid isomerase-like protein